MANKGLNRVEVRAGDIPNIGSFTSCYCNEPAIRGETAEPSITIGYMEFSHNFSGIRVLNCDNFLIRQSKLGMAWRKGNVDTIICRWDLVTIGIPLPDFVIRCRDDVLRIYGREDDIICPSLLVYSLKELSCLNIPQTNCVILRS